MTVTKLQDRLVDSDITPEWFADSVKALNLQSIPQHQRGNALREHILKVMAHSVQDPKVRTDLQRALESMTTRKELML